MGVVSRDLRCRIVAPEAGNHRTGGHLVNCRLAADPRIELVEVRNLARSAHSLTRSTPAEVSLLIDSLFLRDTRGIESLRRRFGGRIGLLAHSLPSLIPGHPAPARHRMLEAEMRALRFFDLIVSPSRFLAAALERRGALPARVAIVPLSPLVDGREGTAADRSEAPGDTGGGPRRVVRILTVANWSPAKGIHLAWQALSELRDLDWEWHIVGKSGRTRYSRQLRGSIRASTLVGRVSLIESADERELDAQYRSSDIFLLPTLMESFGLAPAEAATYGLPVIATTAGAVGEVMGDGARLLGAGDRAGLTRCLREMIERPATREDAAARARSSATQFPRWPQVAEALIAALLPDAVVTPEMR